MPRPALIDAEMGRIKYLATLLNTCAACFTIGIAGPIAASLYGASQRIASWTFALEACGWLLVSASLHLSVRRVPGRLR